ncbi:hypothetical protein BGM25_23860 [Bacillus sp. FJAT-29953]|nr:hypothetical protein [Bacillus sp. FJAT-29953]
MKMITEFYDQFDVNQDRVNLWHEALKGFDFEKLKQKLFSFMSVSPYPPKISDLVHKSTEGRAVTDVAETMKILSLIYEPAQEEVVDQELAKMREMMGL